MLKLNVHLISIQMSSQIGHLANIKKINKNYQSCEGKNLKMMKITCFKLNVLNKITLSLFPSVICLHYN